MKSLSIGLILIFYATTVVLGQEQEVASLFRSQSTLDIALRISMKDIKRSNSDTVYFPAILRFHSGPEVWDSIPIGIRARGNFRRKHCLFPPLRIKIKKGDAKGTLFEGTKSLKLVMPCQSAKNYSALIYKEYLCYKLYEPVSKYSFSTRLVDITLEDTGGKGTKTYHLNGFVIEDDDAVARRLNADAKDEQMIHPMHLQDTGALRLDLFQYMIANTDFSTGFLHNAKVIQTQTNQKIPLPYDFDMAGFVNAPYATFDESLGIRSVRDRLYKGYCRSAEVTAFVRQEFVGLEPTLNEIIEHHKTLFEEKDFEGIKKYMSAFFVVLNDDGFYKTNILQKCREK